MRHRDLFFHSRNATPDSAFRKKFLGARPFDTLHTNRRSWHAKMGDKNPFHFAVAKLLLGYLLATYSRGLRLTLAVVDAPGEPTIFLTLNIAIELISLMGIPTSETKDTVL